MVRCLMAILALGILLLAPIADGRAQQPPRVVSIGACRFAGGGSIDDCRVAYRSFGKLNAARSNAVLIPTWLLGRSEEWTPLLGPRGYVDTTQFFVIVVDALANGHSSSPSTVPVSARRAFNGLTIGDMVESQYQLVTKALAIPRLHAVVGFSMGGMQALEWAVRYPTFLDRAVSIGGAPRIGAFDHLMWTTMLAEIEIARRTRATPDSVWLQLARLEALFLQTPGALNESTWDSVATTATKQGKVYHETWTLDDYAAQLRAIRRHDVSAALGADLPRAARAVRARLLIVHSPDDYMVTPGPAFAFARLVGAETISVPSRCGHVAFFCEQERLASAVRKFLTP